jgi:anti-sigma factor RsiW
MNCFDTRKQFSAFWRRTLEPGQRAAFSAHLNGCAKCDRSFRVFALSAPVLHGEREPEARSQPHLARTQPRPVSPRKMTMARRNGGFQWLAMAAAAVLVVASGLAAWTAANPPHQNVMEAIAGDNPSIEQVSYSPDASLFGQDVTGPDPALQEPLAPDNSTAQAEGLAG